jgi:hypothetical protein
MDSVTEVMAVSGVRTMVGDFNHDGHVNAADYVTWRKGLGTTFAPSGYNIWRANFGASGSGAGASFDSAVPEPTTTAIILVALLGLEIPAGRMIGPVGMRQRG